MGLMKQANLEASKIVSKANVRETPKGLRGGQGMSVVMNSKQLDTLIKQLPKRMHNSVLKKATEAAADIVRVAAEVEIAVVKRQTPAPGPIGDSRKTGTRKKWGAKPRRDRVGAQLKDMSNTVSVKTVKWKPGMPCLTMVGTDYYAYNYGHTHEPLEGKKPANIKLWNTGKRYQLPERPWLRPAGITTAGLQFQAMKRIIKAKMKNL